MKSKLHSKGDQIEGHDVTFQMRITAKIFDIIEYCKNEKNQQLKKIQIGKMVQNGKKAHIFFRRLILETHTYT